MNDQLHLLEILLKVIFNNTNNWLKHKNQQINKYMNK